MGSERSREPGPTGMLLGADPCISNDRDDHAEHDEIGHSIRLLGSARESHHSHKISGAKAWSVEMEEEKH